MAVPYSGGVPEVDPAATPPSDYQNIRADAGSFGGATAQAVKELGAGATKAGRFFGEVAADEGANQFQEETNKILHGDSSRQVPGPDGTMQPDLGYLGLKGRAALDARPAAEKAIEANLKSIRDNLTTPEQILKFDNFSRRYRTYAVGQIGTHADNQANGWYAQVNHSSEKLALTHIAANADNPVQVAAGASDLIQARVKQAQLRGGGDVLVGEAISSAKADALRAQVDAIAIGDPVRAMRILDNNRAVAGAQYPVIASHLRARVDQANGHTIADEVLGAVPISSSTIKRAILNQESGDNPNVVTSTDNAKGPGQILDATFARYAKPGERIDNPADNRAVSGRILDDYFQKYNGDAARVAVAYFSGPGNVAPPGSPTPWKEDRKDGNGATTSGYVAALLKRVGGAQQPSATGPMPDKATAYERILALTPDNPNEQSAAISRMNQRFAVYHQEETQRMGAFKSRVDDSVTEAMATGAVRTPLSEVDFVQNLGPEAGARAYETYQGNVRFGADFAAVATMSDEQQDAVVSKWTPNATEDFASRLKRQDELRAAVGRVRKERADDPAGFAMRSVPAVNAAYQNMLKVASDPTANDETKAAARKAYANTTFAAQATVGIPEELRSPITVRQAQQYAITLGIPGQNPRQIATTVVDRIVNDWGTELAPSVFRSVMGSYKVERDVSDAIFAIARKKGLNQPVTGEDMDRVRQAEDLAARERAVDWSTEPTPPKSATPPQFIPNQVMIAPADITRLRTKTIDPIAFDEKYGAGAAVYVSKQRGLQ